MASRSRKTISSNPLDDIKPQGILKNTSSKNTSLKDNSSKVIAKAPKKVAVKK